MKPISELPGDLDKFMSLVVKDTIGNIQADLGSDNISPTDEGRFRSNWFASVGTNDKTTDSLNSPQTDAQQLPLDWRKKYNLVNNLPYAERLCFGNWAVDKSPNWFPAYFPRDGKNAFEAAVTAALRKV